MTDDNEGWSRCKTLGHEWGYCTDGAFCILCGEKKPTKDAVYEKMVFFLRDQDLRMKKESAK